MPVLSITEDEISAALRSWLLDVLDDGVQVLRSQQNRTPEPRQPDFVLMTFTARHRLSTNTQSWGVAATELDQQQSLRIDLQIDVHGPNSTDNALVIAQLFRSEVGCEALDAAGIQPLYCSDGRQMPFINAEHEYEDRWVMEAVIQANPVVSTRADFADSVTVELRSPVDGR